MTANSKRPSRRIRHGVQFAMHAEEQPITDLQLILTNCHEHNIVNNFYCYYAIQITRTSTQAWPPYIISQ